MIDELFLKMLPVANFLLAYGSWLVLEGKYLFDAAFFIGFFLQFSKSVFFPIIVTVKSINFLFCFVNEQPYLVKMFIFDDCWSEVSIDELEVDTSLTIEAV